MIPTDPLTATMRHYTEDGGRTDVECTRCDWSLPGEQHHGHGTPDRPGGADYVDAVMPVIGQHIDTTGHAVRVITTTWHATGGVEQDSQLIHPRHNTEETR